MDSLSGISSMPPLEAYCLA